MIIFKFQREKLSMERRIKDEKWKDFIKDFKNNSDKWYKDQIENDWEFDKETQLRIINECLYINDQECVIKFIKNPKKITFLNMIKQDEQTIQYINNPTEEMCLEAIKRCGNTIKYIKNQSKEMQLEAVKQNGSAIKYINNPTEQMYLEAVKQKGFVIEYIDNPTEEICLTAVKNYGRSIKYIKNPSKEVCLEAIKQDSSAIEFIKNPTEEMCLEAVKQKGYSIKYISKKNQTYDIIQAFFNYYLNKTGDYNYKESYYKYLNKRFITKDQALIMIQDYPENINLVSRKIQKELVKIKPELEKYLNKQEIEIDNDFFE